MNEAVQMFDPSQMQGIAETFGADQVVETMDFSDDILIPVGRYINPARTIEKAFNDNGTAKVTFLLTGGLHSVGNGGHVFGGGKYPIKAWVNSKLFSFDGQTGQTSSLSQYLKSVGVDTKGKTVGEMLNLVPETLNTPVYARVGRTDKSEKNEATGEWVNGGLKTRDFVIGTNELGDPTYGSTVTKGGKTYKAKARVEGFSLIK